MTTPIININALTPAETEEAVKTAGVHKTRLTGAKAFVSAMFAGSFIGFGALFYLIVTSDPAMSWGPKRFVGGLAFCMGLVLVLCCGAELFTGNSLMASDLASRRISWPAMLRNWVIVWFGNLAGGLLLVALITLAGTMGLNDGLVGETAVATAVAKVTPDWGTLFVRGILCNILVCLAVRVGFSARSVGDKVLGILLPISGFVAMGFEHCVANMFFLPIGLICKLLGFGSDVAGVDALTVTAILYNLSAATLGNIIGGTVFVALGYWFINRRPGK
ncbi:formate transporter FocA [Bifidobacterium lemurum]|uniref:Formate transporter FocA n=1 Tax=Bifidobacterium lemurum TaxID=1603886 RepID=A0A261FTB4_9BIFI|nr:formate/nitrite transporter family protein [Bifidobacterium lemurum]OZG62399.1 formate transporter FocA [Bifidobacterium lemurum]QOL33751.1 formate/nitrite transporter family protein [Bifidobacterium lemurum]